MRSQLDLPPPDLMAVDSARRTLDLCGVIDTKINVFGYTDIQATAWAKTANKVFHGLLQNASSGSGLHSQVPA